MNKYSKIIFPNLLALAITFVSGSTGEHSQLFFPLQNHSTTEHHEETSVEEHIIYSSVKGKIKLIPRKKLFKSTFPNQTDPGFTLYVKSPHHLIFLSHVLTETVVLRT